MRAIWISLLASLPLQPSRVPSRPSERFTVYVEMAQDAALVPGESSEKVLEDVVGGIKKRKKWLFLAAGPDKAEVFVQVLRHRVRREHVGTLGTRVRDRARRLSRDEIQAVDYVDVNRFSERHYILAEVRGLGLWREMVGFDGREEGASRERAASELGKELEVFLKQNYWDLEESRRRISAGGLETESAESTSSVSNPAPSSPRAGPYVEAYLEAVETYRWGGFDEAAVAISSLTRSELYAGGNHFLALDRSAGELKAAALLHTQSVTRPPSKSLSPIERARRTALELEMAKRYSQAIPDPGDRERFQKRWHLAAAYYFHAGFRSIEAISLLSSGLQLFPGDRDLLYALGALQEASAALSGKGEGLVEAELIYRLLLAAEDSPPDLFVRLSHVSLRLGRLDEAEDWIERAELTRPAGERPLAFLMVKGRLAAEWRDWRKARELFQEASNGDPACQACIVALAGAEQQLGNRDRAGRFVAEWLAAKTGKGPDGWWRFLIGPAAGYEALLHELQSEVLES